MWHSLGGRLERPGSQKWGSVRTECRRKRPMTRLHGTKHDNVCCWGVKAAILDISIHKWHSHSETSTWKSRRNSSGELWWTQTMYKSCHFMCQSVRLCPQIGSVSPPLLSITFHCGSSASWGIILSDIWLLLPPLSRKQGQVGSLRIETLGLMRFPSCLLLCNVTGAKVGYWRATLMGSLATVLGHSGFSFLLLGHLPNKTPFIVHSS